MTEVLMLRWRRPGRYQFLGWLAIDNGLICYPTDGLTFDELNASRFRQVLLPRQLAYPTTAEALTATG